MRVAVWDNLPSGGGKRALYDQATRLAARGHQLEFWCPDTAETGYLPLASAGPQHVLPLAARPRRGPPARIWAVQAWRNLRAAEDLLAALDRHARQCAEEIDRGGFDVAFVNASQFLAAPALGRHLKTPSVLYLPEPTRFLYEARPALPWLLHGPDGRREPARRLTPWRAAGDALELRLYRALGSAEWVNVRAFGRVLVNSLFSRETIARVFGIESHVCYLGIDTKRFAPPTGAAKRPYVVSLGEFTAAKGPDRAIRALGALPAAGRPPLEWVCNRVDAEYAAAMDRLSAELGVSLRRRAGVADEQVRALLGEAAAMLYVSRLEPFGLAPLEANACGTVVVALAEGGIRETVVDGANGTLVRDDAPQALAAALEPYLRDLELARESGRRARSHVVAAWNWERSVEDLEARLADAAQGRQQGGRA